MEEASMYRQHIPTAWATKSLRVAVDKVPDEVRQTSVLRPDQTFHALKYFAPEETKLVILGQDPYPAAGKAHGLSFGLHPNWVIENPGKILRSSFKSLATEVARTASPEVGGFLDPTLIPWAEQGVLLLNTQLSVAEEAPLSHKGAWDEAVAAILEQLPERVVWMAWGSPAQRVAKKYSKESHWILEASHPCKFSCSRGKNPYIGCDHFNLANTILTEWGMDPIEWLENENEFTI